jgi:deazaflavin-dependent oxidoreductase (nitroreductase family)
MSATTPNRSPSLGARITRSIARLTAPIARPIAGRRFFPLWAVIHHRGRRSGRAYAIPVAVHVSGDSFTIPLPWGEETQWLRNVVAANSCRVRWRGADHVGDAPRIVAFDDAPDAFRAPHRSLMRASGVRSFLRLRRRGGTS